jgi:hypothetical protein
MKKMLAIMLVMSLTSVSCNKSGGSSSGQSTQSTSTASGSGNTTTDPGTGTTDPTPKPPTGTSSLPAQALNFTTNVTQVNFTADQKAKYDKAVQIVKLVVATEEFRKQILNYTYNGAKQFADNRGLTNAQIYQSILDAAETLQPAKNNRMDIEVELYYAANTVVGYTNGSTKRIYVNTKFFNQYAANSVAGNLTHEWLHKLGYAHDFAVTAKRPYSVPYAIGYIMGNIGKNFL